MGNITVSSYWQNKGFTDEEQVAEHKRTQHINYVLMTQRRKGIEQNKDQYSVQIRELLLKAIGDIEYKNEMADEIINNLFEQFSLRERSKPRRIEVQEIRGE